MIEISERIAIINTLSSLFHTEGLTLTTQQKNQIKDVILEHVTFLQAGIVDNKPTEDKK
jgi:hypothetical protein